MSTSEIRYLSVAETAALLRSVLKREFPGQLFTVRSKSYAGGASIRVGWTGGPSSKAVNAIACQYSNKYFDGMIDMAVHVDRWLLPDGTMSFAATQGTEGSRGYIARDSHAAPVPDAQLVSTGAGYVFCEREPAPGELHMVYGRAAWGDPRTACEVMMSEQFTTDTLEAVTCEECRAKVAQDMAEHEAFMAEYNARQTVAASAPAVESAPIVEPEPVAARPVLQLVQPESAPSRAELLNRAAMLNAELQTILGQLAGLDAPAAVVEDVAF